MREWRENGILAHLRRDWPAIDLGTYLPLTHTHTYTPHAYIHPNADKRHYWGDLRSHQPGHVSKLSPV